MTKFSINKAEAAAFFTEAAMRGLSSAAALAELRAAEWNRPAHTPTVRRLAKPLIEALDEHHQDERLHREWVAARSARNAAAIAALSPATLAALREQAVGARGNAANRAARAAAVAHGIEADTIDQLGAALFGSTLDFHRARARA